MTDKPLKIYTIKNENSAVFKEKSSEFIAYAFPLCSEEVFTAKLTGIKKEHYKARHHCYAFKLPETAKSSDAGEPSGTAGVRISNAIDHFSLQNTGVVVVRYFGGIKLGVGPLGKAYYTAAHMALEGAEIIQKQLHLQTRITSPLTEQHLVFSILSRAGIIDIKTNFSDECIFEVLIRKEETANISKLFRDHYKIGISFSEEIYI